MKQLILLVMTFLLAGCITTRDGPPLEDTLPPKAIIVDKDGLVEIDKALPQISLQKMSDTELYAYTTNLNWRMFRHYSTVRIINQYARTRGWETPDTAPICRYAVIPDMPALDNFRAGDVENGDDLTEMLMVYIYDIQTEAELSKAVFDEQVKQMQFFCIY